MNDEVVEMQVVEHLHDIMDILGIEHTEGNRETPKRIAKMWHREVFLNLKEDKSKEKYFFEKLKKFPSEDYEGKLLVCRDIPFSSMCEHHWMPFFGTVTVGYVPYKHIIGLSKIPRIVEFYSKRPQLQERYTNDIADRIFEYLNPLYVFVEVTAKHTCVSCRGIELPCETKTFVVRENYNMTEYSPSQLSKYLEEFRAMK